MHIDSLASECQYVLLSANMLTKYRFPIIILCNPRVSNLSENYYYFSHGIMDCRRYFDVLWNLAKSPRKVMSPQRQRRDTTMFGGGFWSILSHYRDVKSWKNCPQLEKQSLGNIKKYISINKPKLLNDDLKNKFVFIFSPTLYTIYDININSLIELDS